MGYEPNRSVRPKQRRPSVDVLIAKQGAVRVGPDPAERAHCKPVSDLASDCIPHTGEKCMGSRAGFEKATH
ncbi:GD16562 [Drosophila simulans]|uniref:GD16562 n=1 Tax=Drosophila simulans TaxID=7240 RepID=B4R2Z9_DROSI|nr:GD16562 [Drosophila simulans]